jgi:amino acid transporter
MFFILILTLTSYTSIDLPKIVAESAGRSGWILILATALFFGLTAMAITSLNNRFPGKVMFDYSGEIAGKWISRILVAYYVLYFIVVGVYLKLRLVDFLSANFLPRTPRAIMLAISVMLFGFVSYKGVTNVARLFEFYGVAFLLTTIAICLIMLPQGMLYGILPLVNPAISRALEGRCPSCCSPSAAPRSSWSFRSRGSTGGRRGWPFSRWPSSASFTC